MIFTWSGDTHVTLTCYLHTAVCWDNITRDIDLFAEEGRKSRCPQHTLNNSLFSCCIGEFSLLWKHSDLLLLETAVVGINTDDKRTKQRRSAETGWYLGKRLNSVKIRKHSANYQQILFEKKQQKNTDMTSFFVVSQCGFTSSLSQCV